MNPYGLFIEDTSIGSKYCQSEHFDELMAHFAKSEILFLDHTSTSSVGHFFIRHNYCFNK